MSTSNYTVAPSNASDAAFRAWGLALHTALAAVLTYVTQTGEIDFTTVVAPASTNQSKGFRVYRFNDAHQATLPVFIRVDFGSGASAATHPAIKVQVGMATNGSGTLSVPVTGNLMTAQQIDAQQIGSASTFDCYVSGGDGRVTVCLWPLFWTTAQKPMAFSVERNRDETGATEDQAVFCDFLGNVSSSNPTIFTMNKLGVTTSNVLSTFAKIPYLQGFTTATFGLRMAVFPIIHYSLAKVWNAGTSFFFYSETDLNGNDAVSFDVYGVSHTYIPTQRGIGFLEGSSPQKIMVRND